MNEQTNSAALDYAGFGRRLYAFLIDQSIIQGAALAIAYPIGLYMWGDQEKSIDVLIAFLAQMVPIVTMIQVVAALLYGCLMEGSKKGATWGKAYCKMKVTTTDGGRVSYFYALLRNIGINLMFIVLNVHFMAFLLLLPLYLTPLIDAKVQALYDKMLGLVVIKT